MATAQKHLETIYGDRANWAKNLKKHDAGHHQSGRCLCAGSVDHMPELTLSDIKRWVTEEMRFSADVSRLQKLRPRLHDPSPDVQSEAIAESAAIMGLMGPRPYSTYRCIIDWEGITPEELWQIEQKRAEHHKLFGIAVRMLVQQCCGAMQITYPMLGTVMTQQKQRYFYRGENAFYGESRPSIFRPTEHTASEELLRVLRRLRMNEGGLFLDNLDAVGGWRFGAVNHIALCQHYGLATAMMDVTSDVWTALFFACSTYDDGRWRPLRKSEFEHADSRPGIAKVGGDSRYAILYRALEEPEELRWLYAEAPEDVTESIIPIGYQPLMRCANQHAYGLIARDEHYDMLGDPRFAKYRVRLSEDLCEWVFEHASAVVDAYPQDDISGLSECMGAINKTRVFSRRSFELATSLDGTLRDAAQVESDLESLGYTIVPGDVQFATPDELAKMNKAFPVCRAEELTGAVPQASVSVVMRGGE